MRIVLVDDHPLFAVGFAHALALAEPGLTVHTAATLEQGLALAAPPAEVDIAVIDYRLGAADGLEGLRRFGQQRPQVARVLISGDESAALRTAARAAGASGFLGKSQPLRQIVDALRTVADGGLAFEPVGAPAAGAPQPTLRQMEVLALLAHGQPNKRIASALGIAERTVKLHVTALLTQLGARNRTHLLVRAREQGLL